MRSSAWILACLLIALMSCDHCKNLDCLPPFDTFRFNYLSLSNEDLLSGLTKKYNAEDFKVYSIDINNRKIVSDIGIIQTTPPNLSYIEVYLRSNSGRTFLEVKGMVTDTLDFKFNDSHTRCCGTVTTIYEIELNGSPCSQDLPVIIIEKN